MEQTNTPKRLTASGAVIPGEGVLEGMYVNSTDSSTMILFSSPDTAADEGVAIGATMTPAAGYHYLGNIHSTTGIYLSLPGSAMDITFHIKET